MQRKCQGCNKTFTPPNYSMMRCRSCAKGVGYPKNLTEAEIKERELEQKRKQGEKEEVTKRSNNRPKKTNAKNTPCTCHICGTEFLGTNKRCKFCSPECRKIGESRYNKELYKIRKQQKEICNENIENE